MLKALLRLSICFVAFLPGVPAHALEPTQSITQGTRAKPLDRPPPRYPEEMRTRGVEGWVQLSYVVRKDGSVADAIVEDSSGSRAFDRAAIKSIKRWKFVPASLNDEPVEQCHTKVLILFSLDPREKSQGATRAFIRRYNKVVKLVKAGKLDAARAAIDELGEQKQITLYETSRLWLLRSFIYEWEGDEQGRLSSLKRALTSNGIYVEPALREGLRDAVFGLELRLGHYRDALSTFERMQEQERVNPIPEQLSQAAARLRALEAGKESYAVSALIGPAQEAHQGKGMWHHSLLWRTPQIEPTESGDLDHYELRCDYRRVTGAPKVETAIRIPEDWGECVLYVFGEPGTRFRLVEHASSEFK